MTAAFFDLGTYGVYHCVQGSGSIAELPGDHRAIYIGNCGQGRAKDSVVVLERVNDVSMLRWGALQIWLVDRPSDDPDIARLRIAFEAFRTSWRREQ